MQPACTALARRKTFGDLKKDHSIKLKRIPPNPRKRNQEKKSFFFFCTGGPEIPYGRMPEKKQPRKTDGKFGEMKKQCLLAWENAYK